MFNMWTAMMMGSPTAHGPIHLAAFEWALIITPKKFGWAQQELPWQQCGLLKQEIRDSFELLVINACEINQDHE